MLCSAAAGISPAGAAGAAQAPNSSVKSITPNKRRYDFMVSTFSSVVLSEKIFYNDCG
jgi:hypothetical protein